MKRFRTKRAMQGFSLIELLIVISITLAIASVAVPNIMGTLANVELRGAVHSAAGIVQLVRMDAIKNDTFRETRYANHSSGGTVYADFNGNGLMDSSEPQAQMGRTVMAYSAPSGIPALTNTDTGFLITTTTSVGFSATGQPCSTVTDVSGHRCAVGMVMYFTDTRSMGSPGWAAVTVAPAGRVQTWLWTGSAWAGR